ncbi:hypothetical protein [Streptomyces sp. NPDC102487]|uniref:hypothetical protein n=1 Tax=Streptomyces sp. NPDC102487 TaxID=3366182 RepID=UPI0037FAA0EE
MGYPNTVLVILYFSLFVMFLNVMAYRWVTLMGRSGEWRTIRGTKRFANPVVSSGAAQRAMKVFAHHRADPGVPEEAITAGLDMALSSEKALHSREHSTFLITLALPLIPSVPLAIVNPSIPKETGPTLVVAGAMFTAFIVNMLVAFHGLRRFQGWKKENGDHVSLILTIGLINYLNKGEARSINSLAIEDQVAAICQKLGDFVATSPHLTAPDRRRQIESHVLAVQKRLSGHAAGFFRDGADHTQDAITDLATLLGRLVQGRWLRLLDIADDETADVTTSASAENHDAWLVAGSSAFAAVALASAVTLGVPVSAAAPGAVFLLLGPAALWGRNLGVTPRGLLESAKATLANSGQGSEQQAQAPAPSGEATP